MYSSNQPSPVEHPRSLRDIRRIEVPLHARADGRLAAFEVAAFPGGAFARVFTVAVDSAPALRGRHAHYRCAQLMVCVHGAVEVRCDDGSDSRVDRLDQPNLGLFVPPTIWTEETYLQSGSVLMVLCDRPYEEADYIRDRAVFEAFRTGS